AGTDAQSAGGAGWPVRHLHQEARGRRPRVAVLPSARTDRPGSRGRAHGAAALPTFTPEGRRMTMGVRVRQWKGAHWIFVNHKGKRKATRCASKRAAELARDQIDAKLRTGDLTWFDPPTIAPTAPTVRELARRWLAEDVPLRCKGSTAFEYTRVLNRHWLPRFGDRPVTALRRAELKAAPGR